jgi:hypothetical protein
LQQLLFLEIWKRVLWRIGSLALSKHVNDFGPRRGFPYYNLIVPPIPKPPPLSATGDELISSVGLSPVNLHQYTREKYNSILPICFDWRYPSCCCLYSCTYVY